MSRKISQIVSLISVPLLLITGTLSIYLLAKGYRIDIFNGEISQTGVISVSTTPRKATVTVGEDLTGTSPKTFSGIKVGTYTVSVSKNGYHNWFMTVDLQPEMLIPFDIPLFLTKPDIETLYPLDDEDNIPSPDVQHTYTDGMSKMIVFTTTRATTQGEETDITTDQSTTSSTVEIWGYSTQRRFWEINRRPILMAELNFEPSEIPDPQTVVQDIHVSPNGQKCVVAVGGTTPKSLLLYTNRLNQSQSELPVTYDPSSPYQWSADSIHLMYMKNNELRSLNTDTLSQSVIQEDASSPFTCTTNADGQIFFLSYEKESTDIIQSDPNGSNQTTRISFPLKDSDRILFGDTSTEPLSEQTLTEEITRLNLLDGIFDIRLTPSEDIIILIKPSNIITYTIDEEKIEFYEADSPQFVSFSPDEKRFLYIDGDGTILKEFRFVQDEADPLHQIGPKTLFILDPQTEYQYFTWHPQSLDILFLESLQRPPEDSGTQDTTTLTAFDTESLQRFPLTTLISYEPFSVDNSGDSLAAQCSDTLCSVIFRK